MVRTLDLRGLRCPLPLLRARAVIGDLGPGDALEVLATDPEAPIDLAALASDARLTFAAVPEASGWRITLARTA